jgi:hypothetical protein
MGTLSGPENTPETQLSGRSSSIIRYGNWSNNAFSILYAHQLCSNKKEVTAITSYKNLDRASGVPEGKANEVLVKFDRASGVPEGKINKYLGFLCTAANQATSV